MLMGGWNENRASPATLVPFRKSSVVGQTFDTLEYTHRAPEHELNLLVYPFDSSLLSMSYLCFGICVQFRKRR